MWKVPARIHSMVTCESYIQQIYIKHMSAKCNVIRYTTAQACCSSKNWPNFQATHTKSNGYIKHYHLMLCQTSHALPGCMLISKPDYQTRWWNEVNIIMNKTFYKTKPIGKWVYCLKCHCTIQLRCSKNQVDFQVNVASFFQFDVTYFSPKSWFKRFCFPATNTSKTASVGHMVVMALCVLRIRALHII